MSVAESRHGLHALIPEPAVDHRLYDAGWVATCRCGQDFSPRGGYATKAETLAALNRHLGAL